MKLAIFDFDETLIKENSLSYLFKNILDSKYLLPKLLSIFFKLSTFTNVYNFGIKYTIKRHLYLSCLNGVSEKQLFESGEIVSGKLTPLSKVLDKLIELDKKGVRIWIITATPTPFVKGVINQLSWPVSEVIGTELYKHNGVFTGEFGEECIKDEKVKVIKQAIELKGISPLITDAYGNLPVDIPMLMLASNAYSVNNGNIYTFK
ncbi:MAG: HAD-IB family phosphatase [Cycloclasticus sp.]|nr:HAD-IB family phosphatase [Cycloclasticus sp.]